MINFSIAPSQVNWWADLSGDRNPVHFDKTHAKRAGAEEPFAHGMLALLSTQGHLLKTLQASPRLPFTLYASFRQPTPIGRLLGLNIKEKVPSCRFSLDDMASAKSLISGSISPGFVLPERHAHVRKDISYQRVREVKASIESAFCIAAPNWMTVEAVGFSEYLRIKYGSTGLESQKVMQFDPNQSTILQTHHNVTLFEDTNSNKTKSAIVVEVAEDEVVSMEEITSINSLITIFSEQVPMMRMEIKILAKHSS